VTWEQGGQARLGAWIDGDARIVDLAAEAAAQGMEPAPFTSMLALIEAGEAALDAARGLAADPRDENLRETSAVRLLAPLPAPTQVRDFLCFEGHLRNVIAAAIEMRARASEDPEATRAALRESPAFRIAPVWYQKPLYYTCSRMCVAGPDEEVRWPSYSRLRDFELELAAVIGRCGRDIPHERALQHVFGYTIFNDLSARDEQFAVMEGKLGPGKGKDFDKGNVFGPCIVTSDEIPDPGVLEMCARVNGEEWSRGNSSAMHHRFEDVIAEVSRCETIHPGEILGSGTVPTGSGLEQLRFLEHGDVVELEIERIGVLRTRIVAE
jgi:2-keto-4-pentenoate hydratase/2-oxohepta-3-ene-1,7-dioic acid hydratase in catechol pathway